MLYLAAMSTLHRLVGVANLFFLILITVLIYSPLAMILVGSSIILGILVLLFLTSTVWGIRNAIHYWGGPPKLEVTDHILLSVGVFNGFLLAAALALFIYYGEN